MQSDRICNALFLKVIFVRKGLVYLIDLVMLCLLHTSFMFLDFINLENKFFILFISKILNLSKEHDFSVDSLGLISSCKFLIVTVGSVLDPTPVNYFS